MLMTLFNFSVTAKLDMNVQRRARGFVHVMNRKLTVSAARAVE